MGIGLRTLVLNADYSPITIHPFEKPILAEDAITRVYNHNIPTCVVVEEYERTIKTNQSQFQFRIPSVIARISMAGYNGGGGLVGMKDEFLYYRDHAKCFYCEKPMMLSEMTKDHVVPESKGGKKTWDNIVSSCQSCNHAKADSPAVGRWKLRYEPYQPTYWEILSRRKKHPLELDHVTWVPFFSDWTQITVRENIL